MNNKIDIKLILTEIGLKKFKTIPTFKNTLHSNQIENLIIGSNSLTVNNFIFGTLKRITEYDSINMKIIKL